MGTFAKKLDPGDLLAGLFVVGATALGGPAGFLAGSSAVASASSAVKGAGAKQVELDLAGRQEKLAFKDREVARKRRLNAILGAQRAAAAASGIGLSGSVARISISDAEQAATDRIVDRANTGVTLKRLERQRKSVGRAGVLSAASTLFRTGATIAEGIDIKKKAS